MFTLHLGGMSANMATFESYIKETEETQGTVVTVLRQGYLHKRSTNMRREWKRRFFVLDSLGVLYYYSNKVSLTAISTMPLQRESLCNKAAQNRTAKLQFEADRKPFCRCSLHMLCHIACYVTVLSTRICMLYYCACRCACLLMMHDTSPGL